VSARHQSLTEPADPWPANTDLSLQTIASWGRLSVESHAVVPLRDRTTLRLVLQGREDRGLAHGNGRSYGDVCLNPGHTLWTTRGLDRFIAFDPTNGVLVCEAGVLLKEIIDVALPHGWFLPVSPGTQFATLGGAIANDVHGKNHHAYGTLGEHVESLVLRRTDGTSIECGPAANRYWFEATVGGLGLTGVIVQARLRLKKVPGPWLNTETLTFASLSDFFSLSAQSERDWEYSVAWIDCVGNRRRHGRGVFFRGNHAKHDAADPRLRERTLPFSPPMSLINGGSLRLFNAVYFHASKLRTGSKVAHYRSFFYPLDNVLNWNRIYGPKGFYQYQCVVPRPVEQAAMGELLSAIAGSGTGSFLAVLKTFGDRASPGLLSFPMAGTTLALDFPNLGDRTARLLDRLNAILLAAGGRIYPAKDASMTRELFEKGYPHLAEFMAYRDPRISSAMSRRLMGS
jgi:FAD/FMN-containing dehydrogenase